MSLILHRCQ